MWGILFFLVGIVVFIASSKEGDFSNTKATYFHNRFGIGYGTNFLYSETPHNLVRIPSEYNEVMDACKRGCFNHVRYKAPNNFLHSHEAQPTENAWCLNTCAVVGTLPYFGDKI